MNLQYLIYFQENENGETVMHKIKGDRQSIGGGDNLTHTFESHVIDIYQPTTCYIFSDGYADQFGGPRGRKFMVKRLRKLLEDIQGQDFPSQQKVLEQELDTWMNYAGSTTPQIDDILVMGFQAS